VGVTGDLQSLWVVQHKRQHYSSYNIQYTAQYVIVQGEPQPWCVLVCGLSCPALTSSNSRVLPEEHCCRRRRLSSDTSAAAVTSAHSSDDMHCTAHTAAAAVLAQLSPLAVLNNNGFTRKLQVQSLLLPLLHEVALVLLVPLVQKIIFLKSLLPCLFGIAISGLALVLVVNRQCLACGLA